MTADQQQHRDQAARWIAQLLGPRLVAGFDGADIADRIMTALTAEHWRCVPPAPTVAAIQAIDPSTAAATTRRGAAQARQALGLDRP